MGQVRARGGVAGGQAYSTTIGRDGRRWRLTRGTEGGGIDCRTIGAVWACGVHDSGRSGPKTAVRDDNEATGTRGGGGEASDVS